MALEPSSVVTLSRLRHKLRTSLNHILGYGEMMSEVADIPRRSAILPILRDIRTEALGVLGLVENCLSITDESSPAVRLDDLSVQVRDPLGRLIRLSASLAHEADDDMLGDALRIGSAASRLLSQISLSSPPGPDPRTELCGNTTVPTPIPGARLLIVDDDEANRDILTRTLSRQGYEVESAESGPEALRMLRHGGYDLVLLDVMMPGMDGSAVLREMRADPAISEVPVVMVSAFDEVANVVSCIQAGAIDYLFKPFNPVLMRARLAATLERKRLLDTERARTRELEAMSAELKRSNEDLERFAYAVSHDLQSPLRTMVSFMQLIERRLNNQFDPETKRLITDAISAGKRMSELVKDLLDYSQLTTRPMQKEQVAVGEVIHDVLVDVRPQLEAAGATVEVGELPTILADRVQLRQLFQNLIDNAVKYRKDRAPVVKIFAEALSGQWRLSVADNGIGMKVDEIPGIFEIFHRLHGPDFPGSGIGLATCLRIVERLGGHIDVESEPGAGSTFTVIIPIEHTSVDGAYRQMQIG